MSYIGNTSTTQAFTPAVDYFSGNASTTAFTLSRPVASVAQVQVVVNNVAQNPSSAYTISSNTITFTSAPSSGTNNIYVYYTSPITQVIAPGQGTVTATSMASSTGTGAAVFATSPTLVTPALGTPSALVLTNATGLPAAQLTGTQTIPKATLPTGSVLQVVNATRSGSSVSTTSTSDVSFGATASITPTSSSSKIYVIASGTWYVGTGTSTEYAIAIQRNGTTIPTASNDGLISAYASGDFASTYVITYLDAPATTSATTYLVVAHRVNPGTCTLTNGVRATQLNEITLMEIAA